MKKEILKLVNGTEVLRKQYSLGRIFVTVHHQAACIGEKGKKITGKATPFPGAAQGGVSLIEMLTCFASLLNSCIAMSNSL